MSIITDVIESTKAIIQGMGVTLSYIPKRKWTVEYPDEPVTVQPRYRGQHLLHVDELGREEWSLTVNGVEAFALLARHVNEFQSADFESGIENALNDRAGVTGAYCVWFDDSEC